MSLKRNLTSGILFLLFSVNSFAQSSVQGDLTVKSNPQGAQVTLSGEVIVSGITPARFNHLLVGEYEIRISRPGYESYKSRLLLDPSKPMVLSVDLSKKTKFKAAVRSVFLPGWGQHYGNQKSKGLLFSVLAVGSVAAYFAIDHDFDQKYETYSKAIDSYDSTRATGNISDLTIKKNELDEAQRTAFDSEDDRRIAIGTILAVWTVNIIDAYLSTKQEKGIVSVKGFSLSPNANQDQAGLTISMSF